MGFRIGGGGEEREEEREATFEQLLQFSKTGPYLNLEGKAHFPISQRKKNKIMGNKSDELATALSDNKSGLV